MNQPAPFSSTLASFLDEPWVTRQAVHDWLGEPSTTRLDGQLEVYAAQQEAARDYPRFSDADNTYHYHYILIRYDASQHVRQHDLIVDAGCTASGVCVNDRRCLGQSDCPENITATYRYADKMKATAQELLEIKISDLVIYAAPEEDERVKNSPPVNGACRIYLFRDDSLPLTRVALHDSMPVLLPVQGFLAWESKPGPYRIDIDWSDWKLDFQTKSIDANCPADGVAYLQIKLQKIKTMGWRYDMSVPILPSSTGEENLREKWLVLQ